MLMVIIVKVEVFILEIYRGLIYDIYLISRYLILLENVSDPLIDLPTDVANVTGLQYITLTINISGNENGHSIAELLQNEFDSEVSSPAKFFPYPPAFKNSPSQLFFEEYHD